MRDKYLGPCFPMFLMAPLATCFVVSQAYLLLFAYNNGWPETIARVWTALEFGELQVSSLCMGVSSDNSS